MAKAIVTPNQKGKSSFQRGVHLLKVMYDDNEPPKSYIWGKPDGILYQWKETCWVPLEDYDQSCDCTGPSEIEKMMKEIIESKVNRMKKELEDEIRRDLLNQVISLIKFELNNLDGFATKEWVEAQNYLKEHQSLEGYAKSSDLNTLSNNITNIINNLDFYTTAQIDEKLQNLSDYVTKSELNEMNFASINDVPENVSDLNNDLGYITNDNLNELNTRVSTLENKDFSDYATKTWVDDNYLTIEELEESGKLDLKDYAKLEDLNDYATKDDVSEHFVTKEDQENTNLVVSSALNDLNNRIDNFDLSGYAKLEDISSNYVSNEQLDNYYTKSEIDNAGYLTEHQSLNGYATEQWVENKNYLTLEDAQESGGLIVDLDGYATKEYVNEAISEVPTVDAYTKSESDIKYQEKGDYATQAAVDAIAVPTKTSELTNDSGFITEVPSNYVTDSELSENYYNKTEVDNKISQSGTFDPSQYYTKTDIDNAGYLTEHQDLTAYAKTEDLPENVSELNNDAGYLTQHQSLDNYYNKSEVDALVAGDSGEPVDLTGYATEQWVVSNYVDKDDLRGYTATETVDMMDNAYKE